VSETTRAASIGNSVVSSSFESPAGSAAAIRLAIVAWEPATKRRSAITGADVGEQEDSDESPLARDQVMPRHAVDVPATRARKPGKEHGPPAVALVDDGASLTHELLKAGAQA
jgi:hypothetical protein